LDQVLTRSVRLYELGDVEAPEVPRGFGPVDLDGADARLARTLVRSPLQLFQGRPGSLSDELDDAVVSVRDPSGQAERLGASDQEKAEADALDFSLDDAVKPL
jgi:hypothetical protein